MVREPELPTRTALGITAIKEAQSRTSADAPTKPSRSQVSRANVGAKTGEPLPPIRPEPSCIPDAPPRVTLPDGLSDNGRGMFLVDALCKEWGVAYEGDGGKTVWARILKGGDDN